MAFMNKKYIHSIDYILPIVVDDYGNDLWLAFINTKKEFGRAHASGYYVISKNEQVNDGFITYETEAFWKTKGKELLVIDKDGFYIEEYFERHHSLEWKPKSGTGFQAAGPEFRNDVTRFYVRKNI
jgi:hypothetical protein